jgi:hypothetical protein
MRIALLCVELDRGFGEAGPVALLQELGDTGSLIRSRILKVVLAIPRSNIQLSGQSLDSLGQIWDKFKEGYQPCANKSLRRGW